jgi:hypothetical protein
MKKTLTGPGGLRIVLDSAQIFPDDPGNGTPAMVHLDRKGDATYHFACGEGILYGRDGDVELSATQLNWLAAQEDAVAAFLEAHGG